jgi:uncharacterized membrane protein YhiD involved in acid resistance
MSFMDVFQMNNFGLESISFIEMVFILLLAFGLGLFIFFMYRLTYKKTVIANQFATSLVGLTMITAMIITTITSNLLLSLGMVGALSIVRFRTAIKDPHDIVYMFFAISIGITIGARFYLEAMLGAVMISVLLYLLSKYNTNYNQFILVVEGDFERIDFEKLLKSKKIEYTFKAESKVTTGFERTYEVITTNEIVLSDVLKDEMVKNHQLIAFKSENYI